MTVDDRTRQTEDRLRAALTARAEQISPAPDAWARVSARVERRRFRWRWSLSGFTVAAVAAAAAVALGVASLIPDAGTKVRVEPADRPSQPTGGNGSDDEPGSLPKGPASLPETFLAVRDHSTELVVVETATGRVLRTLVDLGDPPDDEIDRSLHGFIDGVTLASSGDLVYYGTGPEPVTGNRHRVGIDGSGDTRVGAGFSPVAGLRDGDLAWLTIDGIVVDRAGAGGDLFEARRGLEPAVRASDLAWAPNSGQLAYVESSPQGDTSIRVLDLSSGASTLDDAREVPGTRGREFFSPSYRASDGLLGVLEACCGEGAVSVSRTFVVLHPDTGAVVQRVDLPFQAAAVSYDSSGNHQLFVTSSGDVYLRRGESFSQVPGLADVSQVAW